MMKTIGRDSNHRFYKQTSTKSTYVVHIISSDFLFFRGAERVGGRSFYSRGRAGGGSSHFFVVGDIDRLVLRATMAVARRV